MKTVRWGIVGPGRIAHQFARDLGFAPSAELTAVAARSGQKAREFAQQYGVELSFEGYQPLFDSDAVDAIYIATPHSHHLEHAQAALRAGKAVLCEKPLVLAPAEAEALIGTASNTGMYLMEAMWTWFLPAIQQARRWVEEGRIGKLVQIKADFGYPIPYAEDRREWDARLGGGCLLEMGIYPVALNWFFQRRTPNRLSVSSELAPNGAEADVAALFDYGDSRSTLGTSFRAKLQNWAYIIGTEGYIAIPDFWRAKEAQLWQLETCIERFEDERQGDGFEFEIEAASQDILAGRKQSGTVSLDDSLAFQREMAAIKALFST